MSLRLRLFLLAIIAALPAIALLYWDQLDLSRGRYKDVEEQVLTLARLQSAEVDRIAEGALQFLVALAQVPEIRTGGPACGELLARIRSHYHSYGALIRADLDGSVPCSSIGPGPAIGDRLYFRRAVENDAFAVGEYVEGRGTNAPGIHFAYPLRTEDGRIAGVIAAALNLDWFANRLRDKLGPDMTLNVADRNGTILVRIPNNETFRGKNIPDRFRWIVTAPEPGVAQVIGLDGVRQVLGYVPIPVSPHGIHVGVARDLDAAFADLRRAQLRGWAVVLLGLLACLILAWLWSEHGIRRPVAELSALVDRWRHGEYARSGKTWDFSELGRIGRTFDELATTVSDREEKLRQSEAKLQERERYLSTVLDRVPVGIMQTLPDTTYAFVNRSFCEIVGRSREELLGRSFTELTHPDDVVEDVGRFQEALHKRQWYTHRKRYIRPDGSTVWTENTVTHLEVGEGVLAVSVGLRERLQAEERQQRLINELNHRVKNTLATVQALMAMSRRYTGTTEDFIETFSARLQALSNTHNLLTESLWETVSLKEVLKVELEPYGRGRTHIAGEDIELEPQQAIVLGMIIHELATNAAKYGALSRETGSVSVRWSSSQANDKVELNLEWRESGGPPVTRQERQGFGTRLILQSTADLGGAADLRFERGGLVCSMHFVLQRSSPEAPARPN